MLLLYCIQAYQQCGAERCCCAAHGLLNSVAQSDIVVVLYTGLSTVWRRAMLLYCIQATQQCGAERCCCCTAYRLLNSVAQSCLYWAYTVYRLLNLSCIIMSTANVLFQRTPLMPTVFRRVRKIAISGYLLCHACLSVRPNGTTRVPQDRFPLD